MKSARDFEAFSIRRADWVLDGDALRRIRTRVFVEEQSVPADLEWDREDPDAVHLVAVDARARPIGTARLLATGQIGRMAVLPQWRGRGVGRALLRGILEIAHESGRPDPFLNAQVSALPFYLRMGFETDGVQFDEAGIPHRRMVFCNRTLGHRG
jgi:predicted GNAT family N-acyltransferase